MVELINMKRVVIIILNYNGLAIKFKGRGIIQLCLEHLMRTNYDNYRIVVEDDHSTDRSIEYLRSKNVDLIALKKNLYHISRECNIGIMHSLRKYHPDYIVLLNDDIIIKDRNWLTKLVNAAETTGAGVVGCNLVEPTNAEEHEQQNRPYDHRTDEVESVIGACMLISKEALKTVGMFDEEFLSGEEDLDYCLRVKAAGLKVIRNNQVNLIHLEGISTIKQKGTRVVEWRFYGDSISKIHFIKKHYQTPVLRKKISTILDYFGSCIIQRYALDKKRGQFGFALKNRKLWRLKEATRVLLYTLTHESMPTQRTFMKA